MVLWDLKSFKITFWLPEGCNVTETEHTMLVYFFLVYILYLKMEYLSPGLRLESMCHGTHDS